MNEHKFHHNFEDAPSAMCDCSNETEISNHFFLRCPFFSINGQKRLNDLFKIKVSLIISKDKLQLDTLLYGSDENQDTVNKEILNLTISLIRNS